MATISVRRFDYETLKSRLKPGARIVILSCNSCARLSDGLGGASGLENLASRLTADGFDVVHRELLAIACSVDQLAERLEDAAVRKLVEEADVVIPLACRAGEQRARKVLPGTPILSVTETLGKGTATPDGGARLTEPRDGVALRVDDPDGIPIREAAERLGLYPGSF